MGISDCMSKYLVFINGIGSIEINDFGDSEIGIWEMISDQYPDVYKEIDSKDIYDIIKIE